MVIVSTGISVYALHVQSEFMSAAERGDVVLILQKIMKKYEKRSMSYGREQEISAGNYIYGR